MTLSCLPVSYFKSFLYGTKTVDSFIDEARDLRLDAIDLSVLYIEPENHHANARLRRRVENAGKHEAVMKRVVSIHAAETSARGEFAPAVLGTGAVPFKDIFRLLRRHGYDGSISIEEASNTGHAGLAAAVEFIRRVWSEETAS